MAYTGRNIKWNAAEEEILFDEMSKSPSNVKFALIAASRRLPLRSYSSCRSHWYNVLSKRKDITISNVTEEYCTPKETTYSVGIWKRILNLLFRH